MFRHNITYLPTIKDLFSQPRNHVLLEYQIIRTFQTIPNFFPKTFFSILAQTEVLGASLETPRPTLFFLRLSENKAILSRKLLKLILEPYLLNKKLDNMDLGTGEVPSRTNRKILIQTKLYLKKTHLSWEWTSCNPSDNYFFQVNNENIGTTREIC